MNCDLRSLIRSAVAVSSIVAAPVMAQAPITTARPVTRDYAAEMACSARAVAMPADTSIRIAGGREHGKSLFGPGDPLVVKGGSLQGVKVGQEYFARRVIALRRVVRSRNPVSSATSTVTSQAIRVTLIGALWRIPFTTGDVSGCRPRFRGGDS